MPRGKCSRHLPSPEKWGGGCGGYRRCLFSQCRVERCECESALAQRTTPRSTAQALRLAFRPLAWLGLREKGERVSWRPLLHKHTYAYMRPKRAPFSSITHTTQAHFSSCCRQPTSALCRLQVMGAACPRARSARTRAHTHAIYTLPPPHTAWLLTTFNHSFSLRSGLCITVQQDATLSLHDGADAGNYERGHHALAIQLGGGQHQQRATTAEDKVRNPVRSCAPCPDSPRIAWPQDSLRIAWRDSTRTASQLLRSSL